MRRILLPTLLACTLAATAAEPIALWPGTPPGDTVGLPPEADTTKPTDGRIGDKPVIRMGNVSKPTLTFFPAPAEKNTGTTVLVMPGGGYNILAWDLEGTEVVEWLNSIGVNAALLKYRVPRRPGRAPHEAPLQDAQRALGIIRQRAEEWKIDPNRVGVLGFSAGGHLAAMASTSYATRTYDAIDDADKQSARPDFALLIYTAYLTPKGSTDLKLSPELKVTAQTPPTFLAMTQDDPIGVENAYTWALALKNANVPCEVHVYPNGGHGYGLRPSPALATTWPARAADWMKSRGLLDAPK